MVTLLALATPGWGQTDEQRTLDQLDQLQDRIGTLNAQLSRDRQQQGQVQEDLRKTEIALGRLAGEVRANQEQRAEAGERLSALSDRRRTLVDARNQQQALVRRELNAAYQMGRDSQLKVLLSQEDPGSLARAMIYYEYFYQARNEHIQAYRSTLEELKLIEPRILAATAELEAVRSRLAEQQRQLLATRRQREQTLQELLDNIANRGDQLQQLQLDREELEQVLAVIEEALVDMQLPDAYRAFAELRGAMPWPLEGKRRNRFGQPRNAGHMRWQGVTIAASEGSTVAAIHHGRVVYADWLRGSGLLLILDHGDGYMSLYAHNQTLLREVGEWVAAGEYISTVGDSGGQRSSALYFEIRQDGKPVNPGRWCRG